MTNDDGVPSLCLFCRMPVTAGYHAYWDYEGAELPCHHTCKAVLDIANQNFFPAQNYYDRPGEVIGLASVAMDELKIPWHKYPEHIRQERYVKALAVAQRILDKQEVMIRAYCERNQLGTPRIVRECKDSHKQQKELHSILYDARAGDHVVMVNVPKQPIKGRGQGKYLNHLFQFARQRGLTLHSVLYGLDFSKPLPQHIARMVEYLERQFNKPFYNLDAGRMSKVFGLDWYKAQRNNAFNWYVKCIRDAHMSPHEAGRFALQYHSLVVYNRFEDDMATLTISRSKELVESFAKLPISYCTRCNRFAYTPVCFRCNREAFLARKRVVQGVSIDPDNKRYKEMHEVAAVCWLFYCQSNPDQDKKPWLQRKNLVA